MAAMGLVDTFISSQESDAPVASLCSTGALCSWPDTTVCATLLAALRCRLLWLSVGGALPVVLLLLMSLERAPSGICFKRRAATQREVDVNREIGSDNISAVHRLPGCRNACICQCGSGNAADCVSGSGSFRALLHRKLYQSCMHVRLQCYGWNANSFQWSLRKARCGTAKLCNCGVCPEAPAAGSSVVWPTSRTRDLPFRSSTVHDTLLETLNTKGHDDTHGRSQRSWQITASILPDLCQDLLHQKKAVLNSCLLIVPYVACVCRSKPHKLRHALVWCSLIV